MMETIISKSATIINSVIGENCCIGDNSRFCYSSLGDFSYLSVNSHVFSTKIGKFSSVSWNVSINPAKHDLHCFTQHPILFAKKYGMLPDDKPFYKQYDEVTIGNDVWIGCNALIMGGVQIGDGAIIGANARISKNVPPYGIVIGNNEILRYRFDEVLIQELQKLRWWDLPVESIRKIIPILAERPSIESIEKIYTLLEH